MSAWRALAAAVLLLLSGPVAAESLVSTLSDDAIQITSNFTGERIVVFGAIRGIPPGADDYNVAVVVQGPEQDLVVRRKERLLGIWANRSSREFESVPSYYVMHLSENFSRSVRPEQLSEYRLGLQSLSFVKSAETEAAARDFAQAVIDLKTRRGLYVQREGAVEFLDPGVFRTTFFLPSEIPTGEYRVSVYLFRGSSFLAGSTENLNIAKSGFSDRIARFADEQALVYGVLCVALAMGTGWFAGVIFRRP